MRERGERDAARLQHEVAYLVWWGAKAAGARLADVASDLDLTYDILARLLRGQTPMLMWQEETLRAKFGLPKRMAN